MEGIARGMEGVGVGGKTMLRERGRKEPWLATQGLGRAFIPVLFLGVGLAFPILGSELAAMNS